MMARRAVRCLAASLVATLLALPAAHAGAYVVDVEPPLQEAAGSSCGGRIPTVDAVDVPAYVGRWFQVYSNALVAYTFELGGKCVTADYGLLEDGISVHNAQNMWRPNGTISTIDGRAFAPNASKPAELRVEFDSVPFPGSYWIVKLGPVENNQYQYSVVTDRFGLTLFILARNVEDFKSRFEQEVMAFVQPLFQGFLFRPIPTYQGPECLYSEPAPTDAADAAEPVAAAATEQEQEQEQVRVPKPLVAQEKARRHQRLRTSTD